MHGLILDWNEGRFVPADPDTRYGDLHYGGYRNVSDFARVMVGFYADDITAHPRFTAITHDLWEGSAAVHWAAPIAKQPTAEELRTRARLVTTPRAVALRILREHAPSANEDDLLDDVLTPESMASLSNALEAPPLEIFLDEEEDERPKTVRELLDYVARVSAAEIDLPQSGR